MPPQLRPVLRFPGQEAIFNPLSLQITLEQFMSFHLRLQVSLLPFYGFSTASSNYLILQLLVASLR
jgi:hypothetical protein